MSRLPSFDLSIGIRFLSLVLAAYTIHFLYRLYKVRACFQRLQRDGLVRFLFISLLLALESTITDIWNSQCLLIIVFLGTFSSEMLSFQNYLETTPRSLSPLPNASQIPIPRPSLLPEHVALRAPFSRRNLPRRDRAIHPIRITSAQPSRPWKLPPAHHRR